MLWFANLWGFFIVHWRYFAVAGVILLAVIVVGRSCNSDKPAASLNEAEIQRGEQAVKEVNKKELTEILAAADVREQQINANIANGRTETINATLEAKKRYQEMSIEELQAEFNKKK